MTIDEQVTIIEKQLANFDDLLDKMEYLNDYFGKDPEFSREATDIVRGNLCKLM